MYFCPNCHNVFDITRNLGQSGGNDDNNNNIEDNELESQIGGNNDTVDEAYDKLLKKILNEEQINEKELDFVTLEELIKSSPYKRLKFKQKEFAYNKINDLLPLDKKKPLNIQEKTDKNKAYFLCNNCGYKKAIEEGTLIFNRVSNDIAQSYIASEIKEMSYSDILPRTRKYKCPNGKCESHHDPTKREAVFFRLNNTFRIRYICQSCQTMF